MKRHASITACHHTPLLVIWLTVVQEIAHDEQALSGAPVGQVLTRVVALSVKNRRTLRAF
jgi:hypothetical protein